jgi:protein required for attachment to host cells
MLIAAPEFLGHLRDALNAQVRKMVVAEHALDLVSQSPAEIRRRLPDRLYSALESR